MIVAWCGYLGRSPTTVPHILSMHGSRYICSMASLLLYGSARRGHSSSQGQSRSPRSLPLHGLKASSIYAQRGPPGTPLKPNQAQTNGLAQRSGVVDITPELTVIMHQSAG